MRNPGAVWAGIQLLLVAYAGSVGAAPRAGGPLPSGGDGIASRYPGDAGIEKDPAVVFYEGFEEGSSPADLNRRWSGVFGDRSLRITDDAAGVHGGRKALEISMPRQETPQSSGLQKVLESEVDVLFLRFYSKFEKVMPYSPQLGNKGSFGKEFVSRPEIVPELDRWYCFEFMVRANTPGRRDGRIGCWLDGRLIADFPDMRFRDVETLKMERIGIGLYMAKNALRENRKWYDDVVAATAYVGPMVAGKKTPNRAGGAPKAPPRGP